MSSATLANHSRKRSLREDDGDDSDIEVLPHKYQKRQNSREPRDHASSLKENLITFLHWMKNKSVFGNFITCALKSLGYVEDQSDELELEEMVLLKKPDALQVQSHFRSRRDSPFPSQRTSTQLYEAFSGRPDRFVTIHKPNVPRTNFFEAANEECISSKENRPMPKLFSDPMLRSRSIRSRHKWSSHSSNSNGFDVLPSLSYSRFPSVPHEKAKKLPCEKDGILTKASLNNMKLLDCSRLHGNRKGLPFSHKETPLDIQFGTEALSGATKQKNNAKGQLNGHIGSAVPFSTNSNNSFTTNKVIDKHEKEMYKMLLENFSDGSWEPKSTPPSYRNIQTQVNEEDIAHSCKQRNFSANKYLEKYQPKVSFIQKSSSPKLIKPVVSRPIFKLSTPEDEAIDDEKFVFKEKPKPPLVFPSSEKSSFFSPTWIQDLKKSVEEETKERLIIAEEQARQIEECQKRRRERLSLSGTILSEAVSVDKEAEYPELTPEMDCLVDNALMLNPPNEVLSQVNQQQVLRKDMDTLNNMNWLNDEVINFYLSLIAERSKQPGFPSVYSFSSFFYPSLKSKGYGAVKRWTRKVDIFSYEFNLVPLHLGVHWCLAVIDFRHKQIKYYDSMGGKENCLEVLRSYLMNESQDKKKAEFDCAGWSLEVMKDIPPQMNGYDCGMFTLKYAEYLTRDAPITFSQQNMQYFRRKMVYEIMTQKIL